MNPLNHPIDRLFRAAARAPRPLPSTMPSGLESRVLAQLRRGAKGAEDFFNFLPLLRRGLVLACVLALLALVFSFRGLVQQPSEEILIESVTELSYLP